MSLKKNLPVNPLKNVPVNLHLRVINYMMLSSNLTIPPAVGLAMASPASHTVSHMVVKDEDVSQKISAEILATLESEPHVRKSPTWSSDSDTKTDNTISKVKKFIQDMDSGISFWLKHIKLEKDDIQDIKTGQLTSWIIDAYFEAYNLNCVRSQGIYIVKCFDHSDFEEIFDFNGSPKEC
ncbi:hypothetical protein K435DRAFT_811541 [Dendrothele bispora CBS 962.96]|uniref:Uncharacterized protein n=1 Tax=Dendrothele bispora (strain CBS 962.96) TaxID=1314807 RepID=A0A4S8KRS8_DENBC|nr:hypothetical protein K435DRAFT_811541 [Dendrothele bispora CBS 962.96]